MALTFSAPFGRIKCTRISFGLQSASEVQQTKIHQVFGDISDVFVIVIDMLFGAENKEEHNKIPTEILECTHKENVRLNLKKIKLKKTEVKHMRARLRKDGLKPNESKVKAIFKMPNPTDRTGVLRIILMFNFLSPFILHKSSVTAPLRGQTCSNLMNHKKEAMGKLKGILCSNAALNLDKADKPSTVHADASSAGQELVLCKKNQSVVYVSKSLADCKTRYE